MQEALQLQLDMQQDGLTASLEELTSAISGCAREVSFQPHQFIYEACLSVQSCTDASLRLHVRSRQTCRCTSCAAPVLVLPADVAAYSSRWLRALRALPQIGSVHQDLLVVLEGTVVMMTNFLGGPLMADDLHVTSLPNRCLAHDSMITAGKAKAVMLCSHGPEID